MTPKQIKMSKALLEMASEEFGRHGCNDFDLSQFGFTIDEMRAMARSYHAWNGDPEEAENYSDTQLPYFLPDFAAMSFVAHLLLGDK